MFRFLNKENCSILSDLTYSKIRALILLFLMPFGFVNRTLANNYHTIDSLQQQLQSLKSDQGKPELMLEIAKAYYPIETEQSVQYGEKARILFINQKNDHGIGQSTNLIGAVFFARGDFIKAQSLFDTALEYARKTEDSVLTGKILNNLGNSMLNTGQLHMAAEYYIQAGRIFISTDNVSGAISIENNLSSIFRTIGSYDKARKHLLRALEIAQKEQNKRYLASVYQNLASLYTEEEDYKKALQYSLKAYQLFLEEKNVGQSVKVLITLGSIYYETGKHYESDTSYRKALFLAEKYGYIEEKAYILMHLGYLKIETNNPDSARLCLSNSLEMAVEIKDQELEIQLHDYLYYLDSIQGNFQSALNHFRQSGIIRSNLNMSASDVKLKELEKLLNISKEENRIQENTIKKNYKVILSLAVIILLLLFIAIAIVQHVLLKSQRKIANLTQDNLRSQMNPHFIFNILNSIHTFMLRNDMSSSSKYLIKFSHLLRQTLDNSISKIVPIQDEIKSLELYLELESMRMDNKLEYRINIDEDIDPIMFKIPALLLQPYIENSVIHGIQNLKGKGKIEINLNYKENTIFCSIIDNGIGRKKAEEIKRLNGVMRKSHGTKITETRIDLINKIYGKKIGVKYHDIFDENKICKGTCVEFCLPILN